MRQDRHFHRQNSALAASSLFPFYDNFSAPVLNPRWVGSTWTLGGGGVQNTPSTVGAELVTNPGMEGIYVAGVAPNWTLVRGIPVEYVIDPHGGVSSQQVGNPAGNSSYVLSTAFTATNGEWYDFYCWCKNVAGVGGTVYVQGPATYIGTVNNFSAAVWGEVHQTGHARETSNLFYWKIFSATHAVADTNRNAWDDFHCIQLSRPSLFLTVETGVNNLTLEADLTFASSLRPSGIVMCLDNPANPQNYIHLIVSKGAGGSVNLILEKCVAGVYPAPLIDQIIAYGAGKQVKLSKTGTTVKAYYDGVQVGADQVIADAGIISNTKHGLFGSATVNKLDNVGMY